MLRKREIPKVGLNKRDGLGKGILIGKLLSEVNRIAVNTDNLRSPAFYCKKRTDPEAAAGIKDTIILSDSVLYAFD
jgi:hypothetical protein